MKRVVIFTVAALAFVALPAFSEYDYFFIEYEYAGEWGFKGNRDGEFRYPTGVAVDIYGNVSVADWGNHRIQRFTADGIFVDKFRTRSLRKAEAGETFTFIKPLAVAVKVNPPVIYLKSDGNPTELYVDRYYYVSCPDPEYVWPPNPSQQTSSIILYDAEGNWPPLYEFWNNFYGGFQRSKALGIALGPPNRLYVADQGEWLVDVLTLAGSEITRDGVWEDISGNQRFRWVTDIAVAPDGTVYVTNRTNVPYFAPNGEPLGWLESYPATLVCPSCVAVAPDGKVFVVDNNDVGSPPDAPFPPIENDPRIIYFKPDGTFLGELEKPGADPEETWDPRDIAISATGRVYVADTVNHRILYYDLTYNELRPWEAQPQGPVKPVEDDKFPPGGTKREEEMGFFKP